MEREMQETCSSNNLFFAEDKHWRHIAKTLTRVRREAPFRVHNATLRDQTITKGSRLEHRKLTWMNLI
jgi:hypothetical protein